jgi:hypothetical protein
MKQQSDTDVGPPNEMIYTSSVGTVPMSGTLKHKDVLL